MKDVISAFTGSVLKVVREEIKKAGIKVGKLTTWSDRLRTNPYYEVWEDGKSYYVWCGSAYNASDAKTKYLLSLLAKQ